jgi:hypothetical protein
MCLSKLISLIGLGLDALGALIIFTYGLPPALEKNRHMNTYIGGSSTPSAKEIAVDNRYRNFNRLGMFVIAVGFALQLIGNLNWCDKI